MMDISWENYFVTTGRSKYRTGNRSEKDGTDNIFSEKLSGEEHYIKAVPDGNWATCAEVDEIPSKYPLKSEKAIIWAWHAPGTEYRLFHAAESTEENPVLVARGVDESGKLFEERIDVRQIDPYNTSLLELKALERFMPGEFKNISCIAADQMGIKGVRTKFDYITATRKMIEAYRQAHFNDTAKSLEDEMDFVCRYTGSSDRPDREASADFAESDKKNLELYSRAVRERMAAGMSRRCSEELSDMLWKKQNTV